MEITISTYPIGIIQAKVHFNSRISFIVLGASSVCRAQLCSRTISLQRYPCFKRPAVLIPTCRMPPLMWPAVGGYASGDNKGRGLLLYNADLAQAVSIVDRD